MSEELRTLRAYRALIKARLECGCLMTEKDCGLHGPRDVADVMLVSCIFMSEHVRHYCTAAGLTTKAKETGALEGVAGFGVTPNWQFPSPHEESVQLLGASPPAPRAEWKPKYAVGDKVRLRVTGQPNTIKEVLFEKQKYTLEQSGFTWSDDELQPAPWKLPEPPEGMQWHRVQGWRQSWLTDDYRPILAYETLCDDDEYMMDPESAVDWFYPQSCAGMKPEANKGFWRTRRPLPDPSTPSNVNAQASADYWREMYESQTVKLREERDAALGRASEAEKARDVAFNMATVGSRSWKEASVTEVAAENRGVFEYIKQIEDELSTLRASVPAWVPVKKRAPTLEDALLVPDHRGRPMWAVRWCFNTVNGPCVAVGLWNEAIKGSTHWQKLSPLPPLPVETEEGDGFEEFWQSDSDPNPGSAWVYADVKAKAKRAFEAALRFKKFQTTEAQA
jgi:hypothetical protein